MTFTPANALSNIWKAMSTTRYRLYPTCGGMTYYDYDQEQPGPENTRSATRLGRRFRRRLNAAFHACHSGGPRSRARARHKARVLAVRCNRRVSRARPGTYPPWWSVVAEDWYTRDQGKPWPALIRFRHIPKAWLDTWLKQNKMPVPTHAW